MLVVSFLSDAVGVLVCAAFPSVPSVCLCCVNGGSGTGRESGIRGGSLKGPRHGLLELKVIVTPSTKALAFRDKIELNKPDQAVFFYRK